MNKKISDLAAASAPTGAELFEILQGGVNKRVSGNEIITLVGSNGFVDDETPSGAIDDANDTYTLANTPIAGSVKVFLNGIRITVATDYTISGVTITMVTPPTTGDILRVDYRK